MLKKSFVKAEVTDNGTITAYAATFTREPDFVGDVIAKGAFTEFLAKMAKDGTVLPLLYNHDQSLDGFIGKVTDIREDDHGLLFTAEFDDTEKAQRARELAKDGRLAKLSFMYDVLDRCEVELEDGRKANELRKLDVYEVSLALTPCNPDTSVVDVKSGRRNSKADEDSLRGILAKLDDIRNEVVSLLGDDDADENDDANEEKTDAEGGEDDATSKGREADVEYLEAYRKAMICAYGRTGYESEQED